MSFSDIIPIYCDLSLLNKLTLKIDSSIRLATDRPL